MVVLLMLQTGLAFSQLPPPAAPPASAAKAAPAAPATPEEPPAPQAIALADVAVQAEAALAQVRELEKSSRIDDLVVTASEQIPVLRRDASFRSREMRQLLNNNNVLETIRSLEEAWRDLELRATEVTRDLTRGAAQLDQNLKDLKKLDDIWTATSKAATEAAAPAEVLERAREVNSAVAKAEKRVLEDRAKVLALQSKSADIGAQAAESRQALVAASERAVSQLLNRDSLPLWSPRFWSGWANSFSGEASADLVSQGYSLIEYSRMNASRFGFHALFFAVLAVLLASTRSRIRKLSASDGSLRRVKRVYDMPLVSALLIAMLFSTWFYPRPPRALWVLISVLGAAPVLFFVRRVIDRSLYSILYAIIGFYLLDRLALLIAPLPGISRLLFLAEVLCIMLFVVRSKRRFAPAQTLPPGVSPSVRRLVRFGNWMALCLAFIGLAANIGGYVRLASLTVHSALGSAYTAAVLYALMRVGEGVVQGLMYVPPFCRLGMVVRHRMLLTNRFNRWLRWAAILFWMVLTLQGPGLLQALIAFMHSVWRASVTFGTFALSVGTVFNFFFILWASYQLSRLLRFVLEEEVFPNMRLERGLPYAISTLLHYVMLLTGLVLALAAIEVDMTKFTIVAGAFTVGIGFGLQNIVNNFVSGLIVLFERPIKVGDTIQIDDVMGRVQHIGIRASIVHSTTGSEVIIPNAKLISDKVTNWTLANRLRQIVVPVVTKPDINVAEIKGMLQEIARQNRLVVAAPAPEALFIKRGLDTFEFELRVWTDDLDAWLEVKSDLITEINEALRQYEMAAQASPPAAPEGV